MSKVQDRFFRRCILIYLVSLLAVVFTIGCAHVRVPIKNDSALNEQEQLKVAFRQYWNYLAGKEVEKAFACEAPYVQEMISEESYRLYKNLFIKAELQEVEILGMSCEQPFLCCVNCRMTYESKGKKVVRNQRDCWVRVGGKWFHILKNPMLFPQLGALDAGQGLLHSVC